jgi:hypothetical protein
MPAIIAGVPGHPIENVSVSDVSMMQKGGASTAFANIDPPEQEREYPEPSSFGPLPAQGLLVRHAKDVEFRDVEITSIQADQRPFIWLSDVDDATFSLLNLSPRPDLPALRLHATSNLTVSMSPGASQYIDRPRHRRLVPIDAKLVRHILRHMCDEPYPAHPSRQMLHPLSGGTRDGDLLTSSRSASTAYG